MSKNRIVTVLIFAAFVLCFSLMGVPWGASPPFANFSGRMVFTAGDAQVDISGNYNLYECQSAPAMIYLRLTVDGKERQIEIQPSNSSFSGKLTVGENPPQSIDAELVVDGKTVAKGQVALPANKKNGVHIIRFSSAS